MSTHIYQDQGHGHDKKYSSWRRDYPRTRRIRNLYCMDLDWLEWRRGRAVALIETSRTLGKTAKEVLRRFTDNNAGFQAEVLAYAAMKLEVPAFFVAIDDRNVGDNDYAETTFTVTRIIPITPWPSGKNNKFTVEAVARYEGGEAYFNKFICCLPKPVIP